MIAQQRKINVITKKEVAQLYGMSIQGAARRVWIIRKELKLPEAQKLTVIKFCEAEGLQLNEFDEMAKRAGLM